MMTKKTVLLCVMSPLPLRIVIIIPTLSVCSIYSFFSMVHMLLTTTYTIIIIITSCFFEKFCDCASVQ